jgi:hypothetical protein
MNDIVTKREVKHIVANRVSETVRGLTDKLHQTGMGRKRRRKNLSKFSTQLAGFVICRHHARL